MEKITYVKFLLPGAFVPEETTREVKSRNIDDLEIPSNCYCFYFYDIFHDQKEGICLRSGKQNISKRYHVNAQLIKINEEYLKTLERPSGLKFYEGQTLILERLGNYQLYDEKNDIIIIKNNKKEE